MTIERPKKPRGGKRPGQRPPTGKTWKWPATLAKEAARELVRQAITAHLPELISAQVANAQGLKYLVARDAETGKFERIGPEGVKEGVTIEVWEKDPSVQAFTDLMNRAIDKPREQVQEIAMVDLPTRKDRLRAALMRTGKKDAD